MFAQQSNPSGGGMLQSGCIQEGSTHLTSPSSFENQDQSLVQGRRNNFHAASIVSGLGFGGTLLFNRRTSDNVFMQLGSGIVFMHDRQTSNIAGATLTGTVIPFFIGSRINLSSTQTQTFTWTHYAQFGAGPLVGLEYGNTTTFFQYFSKLGFRWGGGAYAGLGSEVQFNEGWAAFAQLELDLYGFLSPIAGRKSYVGPSFSFGIGRFIW